MAEDNGVGCRGDRQHECVAAADGAGHHQVDGIDAQRQRHLATKQCKEKILINPLKVFKYLHRRRINTTDIFAAPFELFCRIFGHLATVPPS